MARKPKSSHRLLMTTSVVLLLPFLISGRTRLLAQAPTPPAKQPRPKHLVQPVLNQEKLSPQLEQILMNWEQKTTQIKVLEGEHTRQTFDTVFLVAKRSTGHFYYEAPDKGRIDLRAVTIKPGVTTSKPHPTTHKMVQFKVEADSPEIWISDGEFITQVDLKNKNGSRYPIPPQMQGVSVINGPLPFLFGMKAQQAKQRYSFRLVRINQQGIFLHIEPRLRQDSANYSSAEVLLDQETYLPKAVQLIDPAQTKVTLFSFGNLKVNKSGKILKMLGGDPFHPRLRGFKIVTYGKVVPSVLGLSWNSAIKVLGGTGFDVQNIRNGKGDAVLKQGKPAPRPELKWVVYDQQPPPRSPLIEGNRIVLTLYVDPKQPSGGQ